jgi:lipopolysaccharide export system protein LptC
MLDRVTMLIAALLLAAVTATSYWYSREMRRPTARTPPTPGAPDFIVEHVSLTQFDDSGQASYRLVAEELSYFSENDDIELGRPHLLSLQPGRPQVQASSERARVTHAGEKVLMQGNVLLQRNGGAGEPPLTLRSERMTVLPDVERFSTDVPVLIEQGTSRLAGAAMDYNNLTRVLTITGGLRGELAAAKQK